MAQVIFVDNNITGFSTHSCRVPSTSKANAMNINVNEIIGIGCWKNRNEFSMFYSNEITEYAPDDTEFNVYIIDLTYFL